MSLIFYLLDVLKILVEQSLIIILTPSEEIRLKPVLHVQSKPHLLVEDVFYSKQVEHVHKSPVAML